MNDGLVVVTGRHLPSSGYHLAVAVSGRVVESSGGGGGSWSSR